MANIIQVNGVPVFLDETKPKMLPSNTSTATTTEDVPQKKEEIDDGLFIQTPIFILFGEFLGYVSLLVGMAEEWCNPKKPFLSKTMETLLEREARTIYDEMLEDYTEEQIHTLYQTFYPCGLDEIESDLIQKRKDHGDDLPF